jgi:hypothetical protein
MVLNHLAAIFLFSGPLFYVGLLLAVDPVGIARISEWFVRVFRSLVHRLGGFPSQEIVEPNQADVSRRVRRVLRFAGCALVVLAIVI